MFRFGPRSSRAEFPAPTNCCISSPLRCSSPTEAHRARLSTNPLRNILSSSPSAPPAEARQSRLSKLRLAACARQPSDRPSRALSRAYDAEELSTRCVRTSADVVVLETTATECPFFTWSDCLARVVGYAASIDADSVR